MAQNGSTQFSLLAGIIQIVGGLCCFAPVETSVSLVGNWEPLLEHVFVAAVTHNGYYTDGEEHPDDSYIAFVHETMKDYAVWGWRCDEIGVSAPLSTAPL